DPQEPCLKHMNGRTRAPRRRSIQGDRAHRIRDHSRCARRGPGQRSKTESRKAGAVTTLHDAQEPYLPNQAGRVRTFSNSPIFSEAFSPDPVNTSTVASPRRMTPRAMSCDNPAAAAADVGST